jgi:hypothetical protein
MNSTPGKIVTHNSKNNREPDIKSLKHMRKSFTLNDKLDFKSKDKSYEIKTINQLTTCKISKYNNFLLGPGDNFDSNGDKEENQYSIFIPQLSEETPVPKNLNKRISILNHSEMKLQKDDQQPHSKLKGIISKGGSKDFKNAFKEIIDIYINKGYKIPDLSIRNNLFKLSPLLVPDDKLDECYEISKEIKIENISKDKNVIYLSKLLNMSLENQFSGNRKLPKINEYKQEGFGKDFSTNRHRDPRDYEEKVKMREIKQINKNIMMLKNLIEEKDIKVMKKKEKLDKISKIKSMREKSLVKEIAKDLNIKDMTSEFPLIHKKSIENSNSDMKRMQGSNANSLLKQKEYVLPQIGKHSPIKTYSLINVLPKTYKTELNPQLDVDPTIIQKMNKNKFMDFVFSKIYTHNADHTELKGIVYNYCKHFLNYEEDQIQNIINQ